MSSYSAFSGLPLPVWQNFTPSTQGITGETVNVARYCMIGKLVHLVYSVSGTASAATRSFTLPVNIAAAQQAGVVSAFGNGYAVSAAATLCMAVPGQTTGGSPSATVCAIYSDIGFTNGWDSSGSWFATLQAFYEAA